MRLNVRYCQVVRLEWVDSAVCSPGATGCFPPAADIQLGQRECRSGPFAKPCERQLMERETASSDDAHPSSHPSFSLRHGDAMRTAVPRDILA